MTHELYDDCNWKNERVVIGTNLLLPSELDFKISVSGNLSNPIDVLKLVHKEGLGGLMERLQSGKDQFPTKFRPSDEKSFDGSKKNFYEVDEVGQISQELLQSIYPNLSKDIELPIKPKEFVGELNTEQQIAFQKWREGLDWGENNGDLIQQ